MRSSARSCRPSCAGGRPGHRRRGRLRTPRSRGGGPVVDRVVVIGGAPGRIIDEIPIDLDRTATPRRFRFDDWLSRHLPVFFKNRCDGHEEGHHESVTSASVEHADAQPRAGRNCITMSGSAGAGGATAALASACRPAGRVHLSLAAWQLAAGHAHRHVLPPHAAWGLVANWRTGSGMGACSAISPRPWSPPSRVS